MAAPRRTERVSDEIRRRLTELIRRELKDPRVSFLSSITRVQMSPDLRYAKVFVSVMGTPDEQQQTVATLTRAAGFHRFECTLQDLARSFLGCLQAGIEQGSG